MRIGSLILFGLLCASAWAQTISKIEITSRQSCTETRERVKMRVILDDGTIRSFWPYVKKGTKTDAELCRMAKDAIQADLDMPEPEETVPVSEIDAVIAKLQKEGKPIVSTTWDDLKAEAAAIQAEVVGR